MSQVKHYNNIFYINMQTYNFISNEDVISIISNVSNVSKIHFGIFRKSVPSPGYLC